ncbi:hypothetical protein [Amycolatopsis samaneae]|uniref:SnoaL-like domain-containing protein n=1 Tax=Amycolatopsis samaneae TaxID=664691 RepID=A0ABW5GN55_9PSEU
MTNPDGFPAWADMSALDDRHAYLRAYASREWGERYVRSIEIDNFRPAYKVAGRRRNGSIADEHSIRWFLGRTLLPIRDVVVSVLAILGGDVSVSYRRCVVEGAPDSAAVEFSDVNRKNQQAMIVDTLYVLWSSKRVTIATLETHGRDFAGMTHLWSGEGPKVPAADGEHRALRWPDGSTVTMDEYVCWDGKIYSSSNLRWGVHWDH